MDDRNTSEGPNPGTPTRILVLIAIIVIALPILLMAGMAAMAAMMGRAGGTMSPGAAAWMVVVLVLLIGVGVALIRAGTRA